MVEGRSDLVEIDGEFRKESTTGGVAIWVGEYHAGTSREKWVWLPGSLVEQDGNTWTMPEWLAKEKGLI